MCSLTIECVLSVCLIRTLYVRVTNSDSDLLSTHELGGTKNASLASARAAAQVELVL